MLTKENLVSAFERLDIDQAYLEDRLGHSIETISDSELYELGIMFNAAIRVAKSRAQDEIKHWNLKEAIEKSRWRTPYRD